MHNSLTAVTSEVNAHEERLTSLENATSAWTTSLQVLEPAVASLRNEIAALQAKCTDLECSSRRSNVRLVGIPEGMEGTQPTKFIAEALQEIFSLCEPPLLARAHRTLAARPAEGQRPRAFVICFHRFDVKEDILRRAIQTKQLKFKEQTVYIFPDFPPEIAKKRAAYYDVKRVLRSRSDVKYGLRGLTGFRITHDGVEHKFDTPDFRWRALQDDSSALSSDKKKLFSVISLILRKDHFFFCQRISYTLRMATGKKWMSPQKQDAGAKRIKTTEDDVASIVSHAIEAQQKAMREIISNMLTEAIQTALIPFNVCINENGAVLRTLKEEMDSLSKNLATITTNVDNLQGSLRKTKKDTNLCLSQIEQMQRKCNDLEDRSHRNNVRLVNLPTGMEGDNPIGFLQKMLPKWIPELSARPCPIEIDRAHRVYSNSNSPKPRSMIFRLLRSPDRQAILQGPRKAKPTLPGGTSLEFYADYSPETAQKRKAFSAVRAKLHQKGAETFLIYPALLRVTYKGQKHSFESPEDADKYITGLDGATARRSLNLQFHEPMEEAV